jgi:hypothetical protein
VCYLSGSTSARDFSSRHVGERYGQKSGRTTAQAIVSQKGIMPAGTSERTRRDGNCELTIEIHRQPSRNRGDAAGVAKPFQELLDEGLLDKHKRIFVVVRPLLPDHKFIVWVEIDRGAVLIADHDIGTSPIKLLLISR